jgi:broad specificity phosphatase PhoE
MHAQSTENCAMRQVGANQIRDQQPDPELSSDGMKQARALSRFLGQRSAGGLLRLPTRTPPRHRIHLTHLYSSPLIRAMVTAQQIARYSGMRPMVWPDLAEHRGIWRFDAKFNTEVGLPGPTRRYFAERFPEFELPGDFAVNPWWGSRLESFEECCSRARRCLDELRSIHSEKQDSVGAITHSAFYNAFLFAVLGISLDSGI